MISVIIPTYNNSEQLARAFESISRQVYRDIEVIVVDDGSAVPVEPQVKSQKSKVKSLEYFYIKHGGANVARNYGFKHSKGEYVVFWDADIVGRPVMLETMLHALEVHSEASYAYSSYLYGLKKFKLWPFDPERLKRMPYIHTTSLIRREHFPGFNESVKRLQDWDLWLTMFEQGHTGVYISEYLFTVSGGGTMSSWLPKYAYQKPFRYFLPQLLRDQRDRYEKAVEAIKRKHSLL